MARARINHPDPVGTLAELKSNPFWKPGEWRTCAAPDDRSGIAGCPAWDSCPFSGGRVFDYEVPEMKGVSGPQNMGVQQIGQNFGNGQPKLVHTVLPCWQVPKRAKKLELMGGVLRIIALEGEEIEESGSLPEDSMVPGQGAVRIWNAQTVKRLVPKFPRPHENKKLYTNSFAAEQAKKYQEQQVSARAGQFFGAVNTKPSDLPQDKPKGGATRG